MMKITYESSEQTPDTPRGGVLGLHFGENRWIAFTWCAASRGPHLCLGSAGAAWKMREADGGMFHLYLVNPLRHVFWMCRKIDYLARADRYVVTES